MSKLIDSHGVFNYEVARLANAQEAVVIKVTLELFLDTNGDKIIV